MAPVDRLDALAVRLTAILAEHGLAVGHAQARRFLEQAASRLLDEALRHGYDAVEALSTDDALRGLAARIADETVAGDVSTDPWAHKPDATFPVFWVPGVIWSVQVAADVTIQQGDTDRAHRLLHLGIGWSDRLHGHFMRRTAGESRDTVPVPRVALFYTSARLREVVTFLVSPDGASLIPDAHSTAQMIATFQMTVYQHGIDG